MAFTRALKRNGATLYLWVVAAGGFSVAGAALLLVPELPSAAGTPGPVVTVTVGPVAPSPSSGAASAGAVGVHGASTPRIVLVTVTPTLGLPPSGPAVSPGPTVAPTPSASATDSASASPSASPSASSTSGGQGVTLALTVKLLPGVDVSVGLP